MSRSNAPVTAPDSDAAEKPRESDAADLGVREEDAAPALDLDPVVAEALREIEAYAEMSVLADERVAVVEAAQELEMDIRDMEEQAGRIDELGRGVDRLFAQVYRDPQAARAAYDAKVVLRGLETATRTLQQDPGRYGKLLGRRLGSVRVGVDSAERAAAREGAVEAAYVGRAYHEALREGKRVGLFATPTDAAKIDPPREAGRTADANEIRPVSPRREEAAGPSRETGEGAVHDIEGASGAPSARRAFESDVRRIYDNPQEAHANYERIARRMGRGRASEILRRQPRSLGAVRSAAGGKGRRALLNRAALRGMAVGRMLEGGPHSGAEKYPGLASARQRLQGLQDRVEALSKHVGHLSAGRTVAERSEAVRTAIQDLTPEQRSQMRHAITDQMDGGKTIEGSRAASQAASSGRSVLPGGAETAGKGSSTVKAAASKRRAGGAARMKRPVVPGLAKQVALHVALRTLERTTRELGGRDVLEI